jgi:hypothetical protein
MSQMSDEDYAHGMGEADEGPEGSNAEDEEMLEDDFVDVDIMEASMTAFGSVSCDEFSARASAIASAAVAGDAEISASVVAALTADSVALRQGGAMAMIVSGDAAVSQGGAQVIVARHVELESSGAGVLVAGDASVARSWVGFMAARNAEISDDSRVIIDTRAGLIIGGLLFGGLGLLAVAVYLGAHRISGRMPHLPRLPGMQGSHGMHGHLHPQMHAHMHRPSLADLPKLPDMSAFTDMIAKLRNAG